VLVAAALLAGPASLPAEVSARGAPTKPIAVVQGNVPHPGLDFNARREAVLKMHAAETRRLARAVAAGDVPQPVAVLWPENSSDIDPYRNPDAARIISAATRQMGVPILVGAVVQAGAVGQHARGSGSTIGHVYNEGIVWDPVTGPGQTYIKRHPVPFGEYVPYRSFFRLFTSKVDLVTADFLPGHRPGNLDVGGVAVGDVICFEIVEDDLVRDVVDGGATVIVVQTNNATFGYTDETYQQQAMSRVRAVEFGREVLISATSGVSTVIRPDGSVESSVPLFTAGYLVPQVPMLSAITPGTVLGAPVRWAATAITPLLLAGEMLFRRRRRTRRAVMVTMERTTTGD
jgi:apolipoprotein N-acyltransferase